MCDYLQSPLVQTLEQEIAWATACKFTSEFFFFNASWQLNIKKKKKNPVFFRVIYQEFTKTSIHFDSKAVSVCIKCRYWEKYVTTHTAAVVKKLWIRRSAWWWIKTAAIKKRERTCVRRTERNHAFKHFREMFLGRSEAVWHQLLWSNTIFSLKHESTTLWLKHPDTVKSHALRKNNYKSLFGGIYSHQYKWLTDV